MDTPNAASLRESRVVAQFRPTLPEEAAGTARGPSEPGPSGIDSSEVLNADDTLDFTDTLARRMVVRSVSVFALAVYVGYLIYRALFTINFEAPIFSLLVYFAEVHGFFSLFLYFHEVWAVRKRKVVAPPAHITVDVFVTTYNEDVELLRQTLRAAVALQYPHQTFVLDDGRRPAVRTLADELGCIYITRSDNTDAKAGNWNNAFKQTSADVIATFDADHVPRPDFLIRTLGFFRDPKVGLVQVPQRYHNLDSVQHSVSWKAKRMHDEQDAFFNLVMPGKDHWNAAFFCGTGAVLRRQALEKHGGILTGTITEDLHTSVVLHSEGWKSVYLNELLVTGLAPADLKSFGVQRLRWAEGNLKVATHVNPLTARGLSAAQRISYFASLYHWTIGIPKLIYYTAPPWMLISGTFPIAHFDRTFLAIYLGFLGSLIVSYHVASRGRGRLLKDELFSMVSFFTLCLAVKRVMFGRGKPAKFEVTPKGASGGFDLKPILPHLALLTFSLLSINWSLMGLGFGVSDDAFGAGVAIFWTAYNMALMLVVLRIGTRPAEKRAGCRFRANFAVELPVDRGGEGTLGVTADISEHGCALLWPEELADNERLIMRVHFGSRSVDWTGVVESSQGVQADGWYRYGIHFPDLTQKDIDLINDSVFSLVVPDLFATLSQPGWLVGQWKRVSARITGRARARALRQSVRVPVRVLHAGGSFVATVRNISASGLSVAAPSPVAVGTEVNLAMFVPGHAWHDTVSVARVIARPSRAGFDTWILGLHFTEEQDETAIESFKQWNVA